MCILDWFGSFVKGKHRASLQLAGEEAKLELLYELPIVFDETAEDTATLSRPKWVSHLLSAGAHAKNGQIWARGSAFQRTSANSCFPSAGLCWESSLKLKHEKEKVVRDAKRSVKAKFPNKMETWIVWIIYPTFLLTTIYSQRSMMIPSGNQWTNGECWKVPASSGTDQRMSLTNTFRFRCSSSFKVQGLFGRGKFHSDQWKG